MSRSIECDDATLLLIRLGFRSVKQVTHDNHFVPQAALRKWTDDWGQIQAFRTIVSHTDVPLWESKSTRGIAFRRDLYTQTIDGIESDQLERWLSQEFEQPAFRVIDKLESGAQLDDLDWRSLAAYFACQDVRTPTSFADSMERWNREIPDLINEVLDESINEISRGVRERPVGRNRSDATGFGNSFRVVVDRGEKANNRLGSIGIEAILGRSMWIDQITHLLTHTIEALYEHKWSILIPCGPIEWITSDCPAMKLNFNSPVEHDFKGGWGSKGTDLIIPLSPKLLLHTQIGTSKPDFIQLNRRGTDLMQMLLAERADRWIFSRQRIKRIQRLRSRVIDAALIKSDQTFWDEWPSKNLDLEQDLALATPGT